MNILIIYPSWEERALLGFEKDIESTVFERVILFENANPINSEKIESVKTKIIEKCENLKLKLETITLDFDSSSSWSILKDLVYTFKGDDKITLDVSTMSRNLVWALLFFIKEIVVSVDFIYHQPNNYSDDWLSRDADLPRLLFKHSGIVSIEKQTLLVIVTGFDIERTKQLVYYYNPSKVVLLIQEPNRLDDDKRNTFELHSDECRKIGLKAEVEVIDCYDQDWGYNVIEKVVSENVANYNIIVSSLGPKLSAVSVYQTYIRHPEIALTYIPCKEYNVNYSEGIGRGFRKKVCFSELRVTK